MKKTAYELMQEAIKTQEIKDQLHRTLADKDAVLLPYSHNFICEIIDRLHNYIDLLEETLKKR